MSGDEHESWQWQLPDISEGQTISLRCSAEKSRGDRRIEALGCGRLRRKSVAQWVGFATDLRAREIKGFA
jgi:hypothetical protein